MSRLWAVHCRDDMPLLLTCVSISMAELLHRYGCCASSCSILMTCSLWFAGNLLQRSARSVDGHGFKSLIPTKRMECTKQLPPTRGACSLRLCLMSPLTHPPAQCLYISRSVLQLFLSVFMFIVLSFFMHLMRSFFLSSFSICRSCFLSFCPILLPFVHSFILSKHGGTTREAKSNNNEHKEAKGTERHYNHNTTRGQARKENTRSNTMKGQKIKHKKHKQKQETTKSERKEAKGNERQYETGKSNKAKGKTQNQKLQRQRREAKLNERP